MQRSNQSVEVKCPACRTANKFNPENRPEYIPCQSCGYNIDVREALQHEVERRQGVGVPPYPADQQSSSSEGGSNAIVVFFALAMVALLGVIGFVIAAAGPGDDARNTGTDNVNEPVVRFAQVIPADQQTGLFENIENNMALPGGTDGIIALSFSRTGDAFLTVAPDSVQIWEAGSFALRFTLNVEGTISGGALSADGDYAAVTAEDRLHLFDARSGQPIITLDNNPYTGPVAADSRGRFFLVGLADGRLAYIEADTQSFSHFLDSSGITDLQYLEISPDGRYAAGAGNDNMPVWEVNSGAVIHVQPGILSTAQPLAFSPDSQFIAAINPQAVTLYRIDGTMVSEYGVYESRIQGVSMRSIAYSPNGAYLATADFRDRVFIWDMTQGAIDEELSSLSTLQTLKFTPDSTQLIGFNENRRIFAWRIR